MNSPSARRNHWKLRLGALGLGLLVAAIIFGTTLAISADLRLLYLDGAILLFGCALWLGPKTGHDWFCAGLLSLPLAGLFGFFVLPQTLFLWPNLLLWAIATALGFLLFASRLKKKITALAAGLSVLGVSAWYCSSYIPDQMKRALTRFGDGAAPAFTLEAVSEGAVSTTAIPGQILVIDFFGTWCPPCIEELPALERIQADLQHRRDIQFVVAATNAGGDTPERLRACAQKRHITLPLAFDPGGKAHAAFGLSGFPGLVVIDRDGRVRFTHQGYNTSETSFRSDLTHLLETL